MSVFKSWWQIIQCAFEFHNYEYYVTGALDALKVCKRCGHMTEVYL